MRKLCVVSLVWSSVLLLVTAQGLWSHVARAADEAAKAEAQKTDAQKTGAQKTDAQKTDAQKTDAQKTDAQKTGAQKTDAPAGDGKTDPAGETPVAEAGAVSDVAEAEDSGSGQPHTKNADSDSHDGEDHESGVPLSFKADLAFWSLIVFLLFVFVLRVGAWKPLAAGLDQREASIRADIAGAEQARVQAEQMLADHAAKLDQVQDEVRAILAEARRDAEHTKQDIIAEAQKEAELTKQRSVTEIERARDAALRDVFDTLSEQVVVATEQVLSRALTDDDQKRFVDDALAQFASASDS